MKMSSSPNAPSSSTLHDEPVHHETSTQQPPLPESKENDPEEAPPESPPQSILAVAATRFAATFQRGSNNSQHATMNELDSSGASSSSKRTTAPVYRQYIYDRIHGESYVSQSQRRKMRAKKSDSNPFSSRSNDTNSSHGLPRHDETGSFLDPNEDPTDWFHRPPHWLCWLPPCVGKCPGLLEQNIVCESVGRIGFQSFKRHNIRRRRLFFVGFTFNFISLALLTVACMAASITNYSLLTHTSFTRGDVLLRVPTKDNNSEMITIQAIFDVGFRSIAVTDLTPDEWLGGNQVRPFEEWCESDIVPIREALCGDCQASSTMFIGSCMFNLIIIVKNMFSDITRMYPRYDVNCVTVSGSLFALISVFVSLWTIYTYQNRCFSNFSQERNDMPFSNDVFAEMPDEIIDEMQAGATVLTTFDWHAGPGLICLVAATFLRIFDAICNFVVPTPTITRRAEERKEYELEFGPRSKANDIGSSSALAWPSTAVGSNNENQPESSISRGSSFPAEASSDNGYQLAALTKDSEDTQYHSAAEEHSVAEGSFENEHYPSGDVVENCDDTGSHVSEPDSLMVTDNHDSDLSDDGTNGSLPQQPSSSSASHLTISKNRFLTSFVEGRFSRRGEEDAVINV